MAAVGWQAVRAYSHNASRGQKIVYGPSALLKALLGGFTWAGQGARLVARAAAHLDRTRQRRGAPAVRLGEAA